MAERNADLGRWWHSLKYEECPITLESLSTLPYPPFSLNSGGNTSYFDGLALASYIVSRGVFQNPLTRQDLTMEDCRCLDDYLDSYCHKYQRQYRKISVAEAFALRSNVHIGRGNNRQNQERVQALRNTATAALAGLFVYGNDRPSLREDNRQLTTTAGSRASTDHQATLDWGFDLSRPFENTAEFSNEGWTVIDDDEAIVVATQRDAYQQTQASFPPLAGDFASVAEPQDVPTADEYLVGKVRSIALEDERKEAVRMQRLEQERKRLLSEALRRREERKEEKRRERARNAMLWEKQKQENEETQRARAEIEAWREEQWERLRVASEAKKQAHRPDPSIKATSITDNNHNNTPEGPNDDKIDEELPTEELAAQKKAKLAAKKKRAKARKKAQKAEEKAVLEQKKAAEALAAKKAASKIQCATCSQGILDSGFEKFGLKFCSTKCAKSAKPIR
eukprot:scaffold1754_cov105-Cylindrotheca_fusiformis.AAC.6